MTKHHHNYMDHNLYGPEHVEAKTKAEKKRLFVLNLILMLISHLKVISLTITVIIACRFLVKKKKKTESETSTSMTQNYDIWSIYSCY